MKTSKKLLSVLLCAIMVLGSAAVGGEGFAQMLDAFCVKANAAEYGKYGLLYYQVENGEVQITDADSECAGDIVIPEEIDGYPVTSIGNGAFAKYFPGITSVIIPDSVTSIGEGAFYFCTGMTSITIPDSVTSIGEGAFNYCKSLTSITIPNSVTSIGDYAFENCTALTSITIPNSVTSIGDYAFENCTALTSITIPDSVTSIGEGAIIGCDNLISLSIGSGITSIDNLPISKLSSISVSDNNPYFSSDEYGVLFNKDKTELIKYPIANGRTSYSIPDTVTSIGSYAFFGCKGLTSVTIPDGVTSIGDYAFENCTALTSVTIPDSVTSIGNDAFAVCSSLTSIIIPDSVTSIGSDAFNCCDALTSVTIGNGIESFNEGAFAYCHALTSINIPDSVTSIGNGAFGGCSSLTSITIPAGVTTIEPSAFAGCASLTNITIPDNVTSIDEMAFYGCLSLENITIPGSVETIGDRAFGLTGLKEIVIQEGVANIGGLAFGLCPALEYVHIPSSVTTIGEMLFYYSDENLKGLITESAEDGDIPQQAADKFLNIEYVKPCICSDSEECYAKKYASEYFDEYSDEEARTVEFKECTGHPEQPSSCVDSQTGIQIVYDADAFSGKEIQLNVTYTSTDEEADALLHDFALSKLSSIFNIYLTFNGNEIQPESPVKVRIPYDNPIENISKIKVFHYFSNASGGLEYEKIGNLTYVDGYIEFYASHFSKFVIVKECDSSVAIRNMAKYNGKSIDYKSTITFFADTENCSDVVWYVNGQRANANNDGSCTVTEAKEDIEIYCTATDVSGNQVRSETEKITVKRGFFDKLIAFFRGLFKSLPVIFQ